MIIARPLQFPTEFICLAFVSIFAAVCVCRAGRAGCGVGGFAWLAQRLLDGPGQAAGWAGLAGSASQRPGQPAWPAGVNSGAWIFPLGCAWIFPHSKIDECLARKPDRKNHAEFMRNSCKIHAKIHAEIHAIIHAARIENPCGIHAEFMQKSCKKSYRSSCHN